VLSISLSGYLEGGEREVRERENEMGVRTVDGGIEPDQIKFDGKSMP